MPRSDLPTADFLSRPWTGVLHALFMHFVWRAGLIFSLISFFWMRPGHAETLCLFAWATVFLDPHDRLVVLDPGALNDALAVAGFYAGTLVLVRFLPFLGRAVLYVFWTNIKFSIPAIFLFLLVPAYIVDEIFIAIEPATNAMRKLAARLREAFLWLPYLTHYFWYRLSGCFLAAEHYIATSSRLARITGRVPFGELKPFIYTPIEPLEEIRLLRIERRRLFSLPSAKLIVCPLDHLPSFEAVSCIPASDFSTAHPILLDGAVHHVSFEVNNIIRRLSSFFSPRLIWISALCIDRQHATERQHHDTSLARAHSRSFRILVCLGESLRVPLATYFVNTVMLWKLALYPSYAIQKFETLCENLQPGTMEDAALEAFLEMLNHPWFEYAWNCPAVSSGKEKTIVYGHELFMWQYFRHVVGFLDDCDRSRIEQIFHQKGRSLRWPSAAIRLSHAV